MVSPYRATPVYVVKSQQKYKKNNLEKWNEINRTSSKKYYDLNREDILQKKREYYKKKKANQNTSQTNSTDNSI